MRLRRLRQRRRERREYSRENRWCTASIEKEKRGIESIAVVLSGTTR
jgi:hypothetical protein